MLWSRRVRGGEGDGEELRIFFAAMRGLTLIAKIKHEQGVQRPDESWTLPQLAHSFKKKVVVRANSTFRPRNN